MCATSVVLQHYVHNSILSDRSTCTALHIQKDTNQSEWNIYTSRELTQINQNNCTSQVALTSVLSPSQINAESDFEMQANLADKT